MRYILRAAGGLPTIIDAKDDVGAEREARRLVQLGFWDGACGIAHIYVHIKREGDEDQHGWGIMVEVYTPAP